MVAFFFGSPPNRQERQEMQEQGSSSPLFVLPQACRYACFSYFFGFCLCPIAGSSLNCKKAKGGLMQKKYKALRMVSGFYRGLGILAFMAGVFLTVLALLGSVRMSSMYRYDSLFTTLNIVPAIITLIGSCLTGTGLYAFGELIELLIAVEENTRASTRALNWITRQQLSKEPQYSPRKNDDIFDDF